MSHKFGWVFPSLSAFYFPHLFVPLAAAGISHSRVCLFVCLCASVFFVLFLLSVLLFLIFDLDCLLGLEMLFFVSFHLSDSLALSLSLSHTFLPFHPLFL